MKKAARLRYAVAALIVISLPLAAQRVDVSMVRSNENFRIGVQAFQKGSFNEAVLSFEKALSLSPQDPLVMNWLARSYYRSGLESTAIRQWQNMIDMGLSTNVISAWAETVKSRRSALGISTEPRTLSEIGAVEGLQGGTRIFQKPTTVRALPDGGAWVVAYGTNEVLKLDANGVVKQRLKGPANGLDHPFDLTLASDGGIFVTEYDGNRVARFSPRGDFIKTFGTKGRGNAQFVGPQYLSIDSSDYLYIGDFGNRRVEKLDTEGNYVLEFGAKKGNFPGLRAPTGVLCMNDLVYVADAYAQSIYVFDESGNYLYALAEGELSAPEALTYYQANSILISDGNRVLSLDLSSYGLEELLRLPKGSSGRITGAAPDANGSVLVCDFNSSRIATYNDSMSLASGLFVQIDRINADKFPVIDVELRVEDLARRPIVGLISSNFNMSESYLSWVGSEKNPSLNLQQIPRFELVYSGYKDTNANVVLVVERSGATEAKKTDIRAAAQSLADALSGRGSLSLVSAGTSPAVEAKSDFRASVLKANTGDYSDEWKFDVAMRLAGGELAAAQSRRAIVFVTDGSLTEAGFARYGLSQIAAYLSNNGISFNVVSLRNQAPDAELQYLCEQTGGKFYYAYRPEGLKPMIDDIIRAANGRYMLRYTSKVDLNFGLDYLPVSVEAYLVRRSGRDDLGCFAPKR